MQVTYHGHSVQATLPPVPGVHDSLHIWFTESKNVENV